jgi:hypothetical protein
LMGKQKIILERTEKNYLLWKGKHED